VSDHAGPFLDSPTRRFARVGREVDRMMPYTLLSIIGVSLVMLAAFVSTRPARPRRREPANRPSNSRKCGNATGCAEPVSHSSQLIVSRRWP
jgi:hypothetical protein